MPVDFGRTSPQTITQRAELSLSRLLEMRSKKLLNCRSLLQTTCPLLFRSTSAIAIFRSEPSVEASRTGEDRASDYTCMH